MTQFLEDGCIFSELEEPGGLCLPSFQDDSGLLAKINERPGENSARHDILTGISRIILPNPDLLASPTKNRGRGVSATD